MIDNCDFSFVHGKLTCFFQGRIDAGCAPQLEQEIQAQVTAAEPGAIVFDLSEVSYISSYFLRVCLKHAKAVGAGNFAVVKARRPVKTIFQLAGLDHMLS